MEKWGVWDQLITTAAGPKMHLEPGEKEAWDNKPGFAPAGGHATPAPKGWHYGDEYPKGSDLDPNSVYDYDGAKSSSKTSSRIDTINQVLEKGVYSDNGKLVKIDGMVLDATTAHMLKTIYDALSPASQAKFDSIPFGKLVDFGWKQVR